MGNRLYKYAGSTYLNKVVGTPGMVTVRCSYPKDFNDPYELFLTIDFNQRPSVLAFYAEVVGDLPQLPTTCFSHSPSVIPMWAHYAQNLEGFVIEFDEDRLADTFPQSGFGDIDYQDAPHETLEALLYHAYEAKKARHLYFLQRSAFSAAYYTKAQCWNYEQERRMIVEESSTRQEDGLRLLDVPNHCVRALICGPRALPETQAVLREKAEQLQCSYFGMIIGRSSPAPFFLDSKGASHVFRSSQIRRTSKRCNSCGEPLPNRAKRCSWCKIDEAIKIDAAKSNIFRAMDHFGLLDGYLKAMDAIGRGAHKGSS